MTIVPDNNEDRHRALRHDTLRQIDDALASLKVEPGYVRIEGADSRNALYDAVWEYKSLPLLDRQNHAVAVAEFDAFERAAIAADDLAQVIGELGPRSLDRLGIHDAPSLSRHLLGISEAAARHNIRQIDSTHIEYSSKVAAYKLAIATLRVYEFYTGRKAGITKPTQSGGQRTGAALDFLRVVFAIAGIVGGLTYVFDKARQAIRQ